jgi:hypothetical protein
MSQNVIAVTHPGMMDFLNQTRARLSPEAQAKVDSHVTRAANVLETVFGELPAWRLIDSPDLWFRLPDYAIAIDVDAAHLREQVTNAIERRDLSEADVRRNVRQNDVSSNGGNPAGSITTSPRGVTMLSFKAVRRLALLGRGERGVRFRDAMEEAIDYADTTERTVMALVLADIERPAVAAKSDPSLAHEAHATIRAMLARGRSIPRWLADQAAGKSTAPVRRAPPVPERDPAQMELVVVSNGKTICHTGTTTRPATHTFETLTAVGRLLDVSHRVAKRRLESTGLLADAWWSWHGQEPGIINGKSVLTSAYAFRPGIVEELLRRESVG